MKKSLPFRVTLAGLLAALLAGSPPTQGADSLVNAQPAVAAPIRASSVLVSSLVAGIVKLVESGVDSGVIISYLEAVGPVHAPPVCTKTPNVATALVNLP